MSCCELKGRKPGPNKATFAAAVAGGLLSSSCCTIQLVLNSFSLGCAGFSVITPYQSYLRAMTGTVLAYMIVKQGFNRRTLFTVMLSLGLMVSQETVRAYNQRSIPGVAWMQQILFSKPPNQTSAAPSRPSPQPEGRSRITMQVIGIKCEGCALRLKNALMSDPDVQDVAVYREQNQVSVWASSSKLGFSELMFAIKQVDFSYQVSLLEEARDITTARRCSSGKCEL